MTNNNIIYIFVYVIMRFYNLIKKKVLKDFWNKLKEGNCIKLVCCGVKIIFGGIYKASDSHVIIVFN